MTPARPAPAATHLREAHAHFHSLGESLGLLSLAACPSLAACLALAKEQAAILRAGPGRPFLRLTSARVQGWPEGRWPTLVELDAVTGEVPCVIMSFDHHAAAANSAAMAVAGLVPGQKVPPAGEVIADPRSGLATGLLMEHAAYQAWRAVPEPTVAERRARVLAALRHLHALGFAEAHDLHSESWLGPLLGELERAGELPMKVVIFPPIDRLAAEAEPVRRAGWESARVRLGGGKVFADGTLNSRTALMLHRYAEPLPNLPRGQAMHSLMALEAFVREADGLGLPLAVHAIGDCAVRMVLDAIERARPATPGFRIEHCELIDGADVPRFARLGVVASVQPCHLLTDIEALNRFVPHRLDRVLPLRELIDAGCTPGELLWFGSDVPIVRADREDSIRAATNRRREGTPESEAIGLAQAITVVEAEGAFVAPGERA
ncbi:MAG: amidohydrolase [Phycisphaerales bacterium]